MKQIKSVEHLKTICVKANKGLKDCYEWVEFFIVLNRGVKSSKTISFQGDCFVVINSIDDTTQELTEQQINDDKITNIGKAIKLGSFYKY